MPRLHEVQVNVGCNAEDIQHLVQHLAVLGRDASTHLKLLRAGLQGANHGGHFDGFGPRAKNDQNLLPRHNAHLSFRREAYNEAK